MSNCHYFHDKYTGTKRESFCVCQCLDRNSRLIFSARWTTPHQLQNPWPYTGFVHPEMSPINWRWMDVVPPRASLVRCSCVESASFWQPFPCWVLWSHKILNCVYFELFRITQNACQFVLVRSLPANAFPFSGVHSPRCTLPKLPVPNVRWIMKSANEYLPLGLVFWGNRGTGSSFHSSRALRFVAWVDSEPYRSFLPGMDEDAKLDTVSGEDIDDWRCRVKLGMMWCTYMQNGTENTVLNSTSHHRSRPRRRTFGHIAFVLNYTPSSLFRVK